MFPNLVTLSANAYESVRENAANGKRLQSARPTEYEIPTWTLASGRQLQVRFINFQDSNGAARIDRSVAYFFNVNNHYESDPLRVRYRLQDLFEKYGYYAKVELMTLDPDHERSARTMTAFLSNALGQVESSFPDWTKYEASSSK